jgi:mRNA-degrading endonuclease RelE of RelBE toxin-antitoxin system
MDPKMRSILGDRGQLPLELLKTGEFERDIKHTGRPLRAVLQSSIGKVSKEPERGKPLGHFSDIFSMRIEGKRLIYHYDKKGQRITLMMYKKRDEVYEYMRQRFGR